MAKEKPRITRLTAILTQLQAKSLVTAREIAEKHQVSLRTVYRDIKTLELSGVPIVTEEGRGYTLLEGYKLPPVMFTEAEANALITAEQIINKNKDQSLSEQYQSAITKVKATLRYTQKEKANLLSKRLQIRTNLKNEKTSSYLIQLQSAITNFQVIHLHYLSLSDYSSERDVEPFALYSTNENWILVAYCQLKEDFRAFRVDRIQQLLSTAKVFKKHPITLEGYLEQCRKKWLPTLDIPLSSLDTTFGSNQKRLTMQKVRIESFTVMGIMVRTTNENNQALNDISKLWEGFLTENIVHKIPNKLNSTVYAIYTNYESDHNKPYDMILGCRVKSTTKIPTGMVVHTIQAGSYAEILCKGDLTQGAVVKTWQQIWESDLDRAYTTDYEVYGAKSLNANAAEVDIYIALN